MKIVYAWLLLVIVLSNWVGGFLYFEISYFVEIQYEMNAAEQTIAQTVQQEIGTESVVKMLNEQPRLKGDVYGDAAFATEISDETVYYTLLDQSTEIQKVTQTAPKSTSSNDDHTLLLKSLFAEFEVTQPNYPTSSVLTPHQTTFYYTSSEEQVFTAILTPPPNFA